MVEASPKLIFMSTCEFSGDMHGAVLATELQKALPDVKLYGIGGAKMAAVGVDLLYDPTKDSTLGFTEALKNVKRLKRLVKEITVAWDRQRPDLMLWLDSGGFNLVLALEAQKRGIPVICMFSPSAWAYGAVRAQKLSQRVALLLSVLPFEKEFYERYGTTVAYIGHPLFDRVKNKVSSQDFRAAHNIAEGTKLVALMPGSRKQEVSSLLPLMLETIVRLKDNSLRLILPVAASIDRSFLQGLLDGYPSLQVELISGEESYDLMAAADVGLLASGTATLEAALLNLPIVVAYRVSKLSFFIYNLMKTPGYVLRVALPNLIAGKNIVPEVLQSDLNVVNLETAVRPLLYDETVNQKIREELRSVREKIGPGGVMERAAAEIKRFLEVSEQAEVKNV